MKAEGQAAPKWCFHHPLLLRTGLQLSWAADPTLTAGTQRFPLAEAATPIADGAAPSKVPSGALKSHLAQGSTQAWNGRLGPHAQVWVSQPAQQEAAMGEGRGARRPASCPSTGSVPRGGSPERALGFSWAG